MSRTGVACRFGFGVVDMETLFPSLGEEVALNSERQHNISIKCDITVKHSSTWHMVLKSICLCNHMTQNDAGHWHAEKAHLIAKTNIVL